MAGRITALVLASLVIFFRCIFDRGVSLGTRTSLRCSFMQTPAALETKLSSKAFAMLASVLVLQGMTIMPSTLNEPLDRKSTRLNSSHLVISYAVFCLKKKKKTHISTKI